MSPWSSFLAWLGIADFVAPPLDLAFIIDPENPHMGLIGTIAPKPAATNVPVVKRTATVTITGSTSPIVVDVTNGPGTFPLSVGDSGSVSMVDTSAGGVESSASVATFADAQDQATAPDSVGFTLAFGPAPAPAPAPAA